MASKVRFEHVLMNDGALTMTVGVAGFEGDRVFTVTDPAAKLEEQDAVLSVQKALSSPGSRVT